MIPSVNFHLWQPCNMRCKFCYAGFLDVKQSVLPKGHLPKQEAISVVQMLADHGFRKITFAGGEPTLCPWLVELVSTAKAVGMTTMIVTNGTRLTDAYLDSLHPCLDWIALSVDSLDVETNRNIGRAVPGRGAITSEEYRALVDRVRVNGFRLKVNTVVNRLNWQEDLASFILHARPERWKVLQALPIKGQNDAHIDDMAVTIDQFNAFVQRHRHLADATNIAPESNEQILGSYVMIDPAGRFFDDTSGAYRYGPSILQSGVSAAMASMDYDTSKFIERGGQWAW